jgi:hypothetical protein
VSGGEYDNAGPTENYFRFSYSGGPLKGVTLSFVHVGGTHGGESAGQYMGRFPGEPNRIGNIGGLGGEGFRYKPHPREGLLQREADGSTQDFM